MRKEYLLLLLRYAQERLLLTETSNRRNYRGLFFLCFFQGLTERKTKSCIFVTTVI